MPWDRRTGRAIPKCTLGWSNKVKRTLEEIEEIPGMLRWRQHHQLLSDGRAADVLMSLPSYYSPTSAYTVHTPPQIY